MPRAPPNPLPEAIRCYFAEIDEQTRETRNKLRCVDDLGVELRGRYCGASGRYPAPFTYVIVIAGAGDIYTASLTVRPGVHADPPLSRHSFWSLREDLAESLTDTVGHAPCCRPADFGAYAPVGPWRHRHEFAASAHFRKRGGRLSDALPSIAEFLPGDVAACRLSQSAAQYLEPSSFTTRRE